MNALSVFRPARFFRLLVSDAMNVGRDPMLIFAIVLSILPAIGFYVGRAALDDAALAAFGVADISRYAAAVALLLPAFLIGWVTGFLFLEDRDDGPLLAIDVTPLGKRGFLAYRTGVTALVTAGITVLACPLVVPQLEWPMVLLLAGLTAAEAVAAAAVLPAIARNKVEGLALTKLTSITAFAPLIAAVPSPLRLVAGVVPTYWVGELLGLAGAAAVPAGLAVALAITSHLAATAAIFWLLGRRAG